MGVEGLYKFISNNFSDVYETINIGDIKKKIVYNRWNTTYIYTINLHEI